VWVADRKAIALLDARGGPFGTKSFRDAVVAADPSWQDVSCGARAEDGTLAAVALLARSHTAESVPPWGYGGVVASRALTSNETLSFLDLAWGQHQFRRLTVRTLGLPGFMGCGRQLATASVVQIADGGAPAAARYARLARRSLRRATAAGATVESAASVDAFWNVYADAAAGGRRVVYPEGLIRRLVGAGVARVHVVRLGDRVVASLLTLISDSHWMCWLAGQTSDGRSIAASYLAYDALIREAEDAGVPAVNLGASVGRGAEFKRHLGAEDVEMFEWRRESARARATRFAAGVASTLSRARMTRPRAT
jgi:hypothetical protein